SFPVRVNTKLQTLNHQIYVCGSRIHSIAQQEANIALKNALFFPLFKIDDRQIPQVIFAHPQLAWVGLTESQAIRAYGKDVVVVRQFFKTLAKAHIQHKTTGVCKVITRRSGEILGAHIVSSDASELIGTIALAINQKLKIQTFRDLAFPSPTFSEILTRVAIEWDSQRLNHNTRLQDFLEDFFRWRRERSKY
ncbi:MAG: mercuric reductase, partial [Phormidesmis sp. CAN_BIN44]|nr:mercuric reductase [Phormidesmis sp. CAN_BIN44]